MNTATNTPKYSTYIATAFETEIEKEFQTKKAMLEYLSTELFAQKNMNSIAVCAFKLDADGYKSFVNTKYSFDNR